MAGGEQHEDEAAAEERGMSGLRGHRSVGGMRASPRDLTFWSFLMATAPGAGLMVLPFVVPDGGGADHAHHGTHAVAGAAEPLAGVLATALHTAGYLAVTGALAIVVYRRLGLRLLREAWINLDAIWAVALVGTGAVILLF